MAEQTSRLSIVIDTGNAENNLNRLRTLLQNLTGSTDSLSDNFDELGDSASNAGRDINNVTTNSGRLTGAFSKLKSVAVGLFAGLGLASLSSQIIAIQREFDGLNAQLLTATGSAENANKAFAEIQEFAKTTPYGLAQSVEGFTKLKNLGLDPSIESLKSFGNTSSAMGKDLMQMIEAVADATTGEFERLKEFGIKSSKEGDKVKFTFQGVTTEVKNNSKDIQRYLLDLGNTKFAGAMDARAKTLDGAIASLGDAWSGLLLKISQGGIGDALANVVRGVDDAISGLAAKLDDPSFVNNFKSAMSLLGDVTQTVATAFGFLFEQVSKVVPYFQMLTDFVSQNKEFFIALGAGILGVLSPIALVYGGALMLTGGLALMSTALTFATTVATAFGAVMAFVTSPLGAVALAIGAVVAVGVLLYRNWETVSDVIGGTIEQIIINFNQLKNDTAQLWQGVTTNISTAWQGIKNAVSSGIESLKSFFANGFNSLTNIANTVFTAIGSRVSASFNTIKSVVSAGVAVVKAVFTTGINVLSTVASTALNLVKNAFSTAFNVIKALVRGDIQGVVTAIRGGLSNAVNIAKTGVQNIVSAFKNLGSLLSQAGRDAIQGFINGIKAKLGEAKATAQNMANSIATTVKSALNIHSPSRVMRELGGYVGDGLALGIKDKQKDVKKQAEELANTVKSAFADLHKQAFMLDNADNPLADAMYRTQFGDLAKASQADKDKFLTTTKALKEFADLQERTKGVTDQIKDLERQIALIDDNSAIAQLNYDIANTDKYAGVATESMDKLRASLEQVELLKEKSAIADKQRELDKAKFLLANSKDPLAQVKWDLQNSAFSQATKDELLLIEQKTQAIGKLKTLQESLQSPTNPFIKPINTATSNQATSGLGGIMSGLASAGNTIGGALGGYSTMQKQFSDEMAVLRSNLDLKNITEAEYYAKSEELLAQHNNAKKALMLDSAENIMGGLTQATKSAFGEQSKAYRAMFAIEKGFAIARSIMAIQQAIAMASANPFPMNLGAMATVASQVGSIVSTIKSVAMPVGQAHDGIMSVPKSGTWNLEKGERVLPKHTAKALDNKLNSIGGGTTVNVVIENHSGASVSQTTDNDGTIRIIVSEELAKQLPQHVNNPNSEFNKALKNNYQLSRRV